MNCLHIISGDLWAGAEVATFHLLNELHRRGVDVSAIVFNHGELATRLLGAGVPTTIIDESHRSFTGLMRETLREVRRVEPSIIHSHRYKEHVVGALVSLASRAVHFRTAHGIPAEGEVVGFRNRLAGWLDHGLSRALSARWIAVSDQLASELRGWRQTISVIPNGLPDARPEMRRDILVAAFQDQVESWFVGYVGRLEPEKRPDRFLRVLHALGPTTAGRPVRGVIIGDGSLAAETRRQIRQLDLQDRVRCLGHRPDGDAILAALDVLLIPSDREGHPMVMLEAMRSGVPVVASAVGGVAASLQGSAYLIPRDNEAQMAASISHLLSGDTARQAWSQQLRTLFRERYSIHRSADRMLEVYAQVSA